MADFVTDNWSGDFNFRAVFQQPPNKEAKSAPWVYSEILMRLFVSMNQKFPVFFYMNIPEAEINEFTIRAKLMYSDANVAQEPVERCETHKNSVSAQEVKSLYVLQCAENCPVKYEQQGKHRSNVIRLTDQMAQDSPLAQPLAIHYSLGCLSSCKAMNRKTTKLVFSLERREAEVGRFSVDIHSSACPGRDAPNAEAKSQRAGRTRRRRASIVEEHEMPKALKLEITSQDDDDDEYYQINKFPPEHLPKVAKVISRLEMETRLNGNAKKRFYRFGKRM